MVLHVVIARYKENVSWIYDAFGDLDANVTFFVYNKGGDVEVLKEQIAPFKEKVVIEELLNVGRESHTYMYHIVKYYKQYTSRTTPVADEPYVLCCQGHIDDHEELVDLPTIRSMVADAKIYRFSKSTAIAHWFGRNSAIPEFKIRRWRGEIVENVPETFGQWFEKHVTDKYCFPRKALWWACAIFCFKSTILATKPLAYFKDLLEQIGKTRNPEIGHFFERSWLYILTNSVPLPMRYYYLKLDDYVMRQLVIKSRKVLENT